MENFEKGPERILTKEEVVEKIKTFAENYEIRRELSDENGLYLFEVTLPDPETGGVMEYMYLRKGENPSKNRTSETTIYKNKFDLDGMPVGGDNVASYDEATGSWKDIV